LMYSSGPFVSARETAFLPSCEAVLQADATLGERDEDARVEVFLEHDNDDDGVEQQIEGLNSGGRLQILSRLYLQQDHQQLLSPPPPPPPQQQQQQHQDLMYHLEVIGEFQSEDCGAPSLSAAATASGIELGLNSG
jgi:hypothetical protein